MARLPRGGGRPARSLPGPVPDGTSHRESAPTRGRYPRQHLDAVCEHHPARERALVPRRRGSRTPDPSLHPLERCGTGGPRQQDRGGHRGPPLHVRLVRRALRGGFQPLLPRQGRRTRGPRLHPGTCLAGHLCPRLPRTPPGRGRPRPVPPRDRHTRQHRPRPVVVSTPPTDAGLLGVPDGIDGTRTDPVDLPGSLQQVPRAPTDR